eukprot:TRINITY_DN15070_c0_g1_i2.p1 TRINITY_DN15070_c0_g1~~TRINITY_DN15070_c0_g1_i2.p1  ORF type:complete len:322 (+),score=55.64 TRINITY_DN15070_c0_g1_i2:109-1074(+)
MEPLSDIKLVSRNLSTNLLASKKRARKEEGKFSCVATSTGDIVASVNQTNSYSKPIVSKSKPRVFRYMSSVLIKNPHTDLLVARENNTVTSPAQVHTLREMNLLSRCNVQRHGQAEKSQLERFESARIRNFVRTKQSSRKFIEVPSQSKISQDRELTEVNLEEIRVKRELVNARRAMTACMKHVAEIKKQEKMKNYNKNRKEEVYTVNPNKRQKEIINRVPLKPIEYTPYSFNNSFKYHREVVDSLPGNLPILRSPAVLHLVPNNRAVVNINNFIQDLAKECNIPANLKDAKGQPPKQETILVIPKAVSYTHLTLPTICSV